MYIHTYNSIIFSTLMFLFNITNHLVFLKAGSVAVLRARCKNKRKSSTESYVLVNKITAINLAIFSLINVNNNFKILKP